MAIGFNIQFRINEKIDSRIIRLTDTSSNDSGFTFGKGNFSITFPDGTNISHTDFNSPDITSIGGYYDFQASSDIYNNVLTGQYVVTYVVLNSSNVAQTPLVRTITDFNWIKPSAVIQNKSDVFIPEVQFYDATDYVNIGNFVGTVSRSFSVPLPTTSEVSGQSATTTGQTLTPVVSGKYYEGLYNISLDATVNYTNSIHSWLTLYYTELTQETISIRQVPTQTQIVTKMNAFRADVDAYKEKNDTQFEILSEEYDIAVALYSHLIARFETNTLDGTQPLLEELLSILEPYDGIYTYKLTQLTPFELGIPQNGYFTLSNGTTTDTFYLQSTLLFGSTNTALGITVSDNAITFVPNFGTTANTFAQGNDSRFHNALTIGTANGLSLAVQALSLSLATTSSSGAMSASDKSKLDGISSGASVTSVGLTMPAAFTVANSPITGAGTISVTGAGNINQYIAGNGSLVTFPTEFTAKNMVTYGRNSTGSTLHRGTIVYISGSTGNVPNFTKARANGEATSARTFGVVRDDISNNSDGYVVSIGSIDNLDTRSNATYPFTNDTLVDGDTVYLDPNTAGYITRVKPSAPNHLVYIGKVIRTTPTNGTIVYQIQNGFEMDELHDVQITSVANKNTLIYDSATSLWKNKNIFGTQGYLPYYDNTLYLKDSPLYTDGINITVGGTTGTGLFNIQGSKTASSAIARGQFINSTLVASANNDVLVGLDINPTFTTGAFTGVTSNALRVSGYSNFINNASAGVLRLQNLSSTGWSSFEIYNSASSLVGGFGWGNASASALASTMYFDVVGNNPFVIRTNNTERIRFFGGGNVGINTGATDAGYRLDVSGTTRFVGTTSSDTAPLGSELAAVTGTGTNWELAGTNLNVGGYTHTTGSVVALTTTLAAVSATYYQITYTITGRTAGTITIAYGGISASGISASGATGQLSSATTALTITPTTDFDGTVVLSIKSIGTSSASSTFSNSSGTSVIEFRAGSSATNLAIGLNAGRRLTTGTGNTFLGWQSGFVNTSGINNTILGYNAGSENTIGSSNTFIGQNAGAKNTTGSSNFFMGSSAGFNNTTASSNIAIGTNSFSGNTTGTQNVVIGTQAYSVHTNTSSNVVIGFQSLSGVTTGGGNATLGNQAGRFISDGVTLTTSLGNSILIGSSAKPLANGDTNEIVIGYQAVGFGSNTTTIGNSSTTLTVLYGSLITGGTAIDACAQFEVDSTTKGILFPRMTTTQKNAIASPVAGLVIYDTTLNKLCVYTTAWQTITSL